MGRVRGRGNKQTAVAVIEDAASGEEEKIPTQRRRGRPHKPARDHAILVGEDHRDKVAENGNASEENPSKDVNTDDAVVDTIRKRKRSAKDGNNNDIVAINRDEEENGIKHPKSETKDTAARIVGFRTNGNRRKNKPRRAAEAGVECK